MFGLGATEILIILGIGVFLFGAKRLPEIGKQLGRVGREFSSGKEEALGKSDSEDSGQAENKQAKSSEPSIEDELKSQLINRLPGIGKVNRIKNTIQKAGKVANMVDNATREKPDNNKKS